MVWRGALGCSVAGGLGKYSNSLQCQWRAVAAAAPTPRIVASFSAIVTQTQRSTACVFDYVAVSDAGGNATTLRLCGTLPPLQIAGSSSAALDVAFVSDRNVRMQGFNVTFAAVPACDPPGSAATVAPPGASGRDEHSNSESCGRVTIAQHVVLWWLPAGCLAVVVTRVVPSVTLCQSDSTT